MKKSFLEALCALSPLLKSQGMGLVLSLVYR